MADFLSEALKWGYSKKDIADFLAQEQDYPIAEARDWGYSDEQIIAHLSGADAASAFTTQFEQGALSSITGIKQMFGAVDDEQVRAEREAADIMAANNPIVGTAGNIIGNIVDPVALPAWLMAPLRGATLAGTLAKRGAAQGAFSGFLEPVVKEDANTGFDSMERAKGAGFGGIVGTVFGGALGGVLGKVGSKEADVAIKAGEDLTAAESKVNTEKALQDVVETDQALATNAVLKQQEDATQLQPIDFEKAIAGPGVKTMTPELEAFVKNEIVIRQDRLDQLRWSQLEEPEVKATEQQVAALLRKAEVAPVQVQKESPEIAALLRTPKNYGSDIQIARLQKEIDSLKESLVKNEQLKQAQKQPEMIQVETRQPGELPPVQRVAQEAPTPAAVTPQRAVPEQGVPPVVAPQVQRAQEAVAPVAEAPAQTTGRSALNLGFGKGTAGAARVPFELAQEGQTPFNTQASKFFGNFNPRSVNINPVLDEVDADYTQIVRKVVGAQGMTGKQLMGRSVAPGDFAGLAKRGSKVEKQLDEKGMSLAEAILAKGKGDMSSDEIVALAPQFYESLDFIKNTVREFNALRQAGKMTDDLETAIMLRTQPHLAIASIWQGQRTKTADKMNAFRYAKQRVLEGKTVANYATSSNPCV